MKRVFIYYLTIAAFAIAFALMACKKETIIYKITFESSGGSVIEQQTVESGGLVTKPADPNRAYHTFGGWYKESGLTNVWNFDSDVVKADLTLYAKWNVNTFFVIFLSNGGTDIDLQLVKAGEKVTKPTDPEREGYLFGGWYKNADYANEWNFENDIVTSHVELYAKWLSTMTLTTAYQGTYYITLQGTGTAIINWGNETPNETVTLLDEYTSIYYTYSDNISRTITIYGSNITFLACSYLTSLDVSQNNALRELLCNNNYFENLNVSNNQALKDLRCYNNYRLTSLDVSKNTLLTRLECYTCKISSLDVSNNPALTDLHCYGNVLTSLKVNGATALKSLQCDRNQLTSLDVSNNSALTDLLCNDNRLTSLKVNGASALKRLECNSNQLSILDVYNNPKLTNLNCYNNQLTDLNVSNNPALIVLSCSNNQLTNLDVYNCPALTNLYCSNNQLISLKVSNNPELTDLNCRNNQLTNLDVSSSIVMRTVQCQDNRFDDFALNDLFGTLHDNDIIGGKSILIKGNPGIGSCDQSIAIAKKWTVNTNF